MSEIRCQLLQLDGISERKNEILSTQEELSRYISDISSLYSTLHNGGVGVECETSHGHLDIRLSNLPRTRSNISRFVKVSLLPSLPSLLHHLGDCHVISLHSNSQSALLTVPLPDLSELVAVQLTVSLLYKCPDVIEARIPEERQIFQFEVYSKTLYTAPACTQNTPHYTTRSLPPLLQQYLNSLSTRDTESAPRDLDSKPRVRVNPRSHDTEVKSRDLFSISVISSQLPEGLPGECKKSVDKTEFVISGLNTEQLYETMIKLREEGGGNRKLAGSVDVSLTSSLEDLSHAYRKLSGVS